MPTTGGVYSGLYCSSIGITNKRGKNYVFNCSLRLISTNEVGLLRQCCRMTADFVIVSQLNRGQIFVIDPRWME